MEENKSTTEVIRQLLDNNEYNYSTIGENDNVFSLGFNIDSPLSSVRCFMRETSFGFLITSISPVGGDSSNKEMMNALTELITRINYNAHLVKFTMDMSDGELRCEIDVPTDPQQSTPSEVFIHLMLTVSTRAWKKYAPCFLGVIFGGKTPEEALELQGEF